MFLCSIRCYSLKTLSWISLLFVRRAQPPPESLCKQHATGINCNRAKSKYFNMQWMFIVQWYQLRAAAGTLSKKSWEFNSIKKYFPAFLEIPYLGGARSNSLLKSLSLSPCFCLKSLKTRLNVFLNVFREGDWRSRLSSGMERGFIAAFLSSQAAMFCSVCVCLLWVEGIKTEIFLRREIKLEGNIFRRGMTKT